MAQAVESPLTCWALSVTSDEVSTPPNSGSLPHLALDCLARTTEMCFPADVGHHRPLEPPAEDDIALGCRARWPDICDDPNALELRHEWDRMAECRAMRTESLVLVTGPC